MHPYYNRPSQEGLYQHFANRFAENTALPVMLYNVPKRTGINLEADTVIRLSKIKNITSLKEANSDFAQITKIVSQTRDDFLVYSGDDDITLPMLALEDTASSASPDTSSAKRSSDDRMPF